MHVFYKSQIYFIHLKEAQLNKIRNGPTTAGLIEFKITHDSNDERTRQLIFDEGSRLTMRVTVVWKLKVSYHNVCLGWALVIWKELMVREQPRQRNSLHLCYEGRDVWYVRLSDLRLTEKDVVANWETKGSPVFMAGDTIGAQKTQKYSSRREQ